MTPLLLLAALAASPSPQAQSAQLTGPCVIALERARAGDPDWLEREMARQKMSERARSNMRAVCLVWIQGRADQRSRP